MTATERAAIVMEKMHAWSQEGIPGREWNARVHGAIVDAIHQAVREEQEICAKLLYDYGNSPEILHQPVFAFCRDMVNAIRARMNHDRQ